MHYSNMATGIFKLTIHMASSLDGIIAKKDNDVSWFETSGNYEKGIHEPATEEFLKSIDCFVMGSRTYEQAMELSKTYGWAYGNVPTIVVSHRNHRFDRQNIEIFAGDLNKLVNERLKPRFRNVWLAGGAMLANEFIRLKLADEIRLSVIPVILGEGTKLFDHIGQEQALDLQNVTAYKSGIVELHYEIRKEPGDILKN